MTISPLEQKKENVRNQPLSYATCTFLKEPKLEKMYPVTATTLLGHPYSEEEVSNVRPAGKVRPYRSPLSDP